MEGSPSRARQERGGRVEGLSIGDVSQIRSRTPITVAGALEIPLRAGATSLAFTASTVTFESPVVTLEASGSVSPPVTFSVFDFGTATVAQSGSTPQIRVVGLPAGVLVDTSDLFTTGNLAVTTPATVPASPKWLLLLGVVMLTALAGCARPRRPRAEVEFGG